MYFSRVSFIYVKCYVRSLCPGWYFLALFDFWDFCLSQNLLEGVSFFSFFQALWSLTLGLYSLVLAKGSRKPLCRFLGSFSFKANSSLEPRATNPDTSAILTSDLDFLFPENLLLPVGALLLCMKVWKVLQNTEVTVEFTSYIFLLYVISFLMPKRSCFIHFTKFYTCLLCKVKYNTFTW